MSLVKPLQEARITPTLLPLFSLLVLSGCFGSAPVREEPLLEESLAEAQPTDEILNILKGLDEAIGRGSSYPLLAQADLQRNESVVIAGYGATAVENGAVIFTDRKISRRFGRNIITQVEGELFTIESPGALPLPGDSGGPCFRENKDQLELVGINSRSTPGRKARYTNTYRYLQWLNAELKRASQTN